MRIQQLLEFTVNKPVIVVDVQPAYPTSFRVVGPVMDFLNKHRGPVLMLVNAEETGVTDDTKDACMEYWVEHGLEEDVLNNIQVFDKGYGALRSWMDQGISVATIIKVIRAMYQHKFNDSRDFAEGELEKLVGLNEWQDWMNDDPISVGWLEVSLLRKYNGCYLCGGGRDECLKEVMILMNAFNIKYTLIEQFIY